MTCTVLGHMDRKSSSRTNIYQLNPSSRYTVALGESKTYIISSATVFRGRKRIVFFGIFHPFLLQLQTGGKQNTHVVPRMAVGRGKREVAGWVGIRTLWCFGEPPQCHPAWNQQLTVINQSKKHQGPPWEIDTEHTEKESPGKMHSEFVDARQRTDKHWHQIEEWCIKKSHDNKIVVSILLCPLRLSHQSFFNNP